MQGIADPDLFQLSEVVQKSSKSGIFSNRRLLMIKDGFLYYYSKVPAEYKGHQPNVMSQLKQYPKSSIEIRTLKDVQAQSPKSSTLIIVFNSKDMIDREDIRKSVQSKKFIHPIKTSSNQVQEWRFTFPSFMRCRVWYSSLHKLMDHFKKNHEGFDKFAQYVANFDNQLRKSLPVTAKNNNRISAPSNRPFEVDAQAPGRFSTNVQSDKLNIHKEGIFAIPEAAEEYDDTESHQSYNPVKITATNEAKKGKQEKQNDVINPKKQQKVPQSNQEKKKEEKEKLPSKDNESNSIVKKASIEKQKVNNPAENIQTAKKQIVQTKLEPEKHTKKEIEIQSPKEAKNKPEKLSPKSQTKIQKENKVIPPEKHQNGIAVEKQKQQQEQKKQQPNRQLQNALRMQEIAESVRRQQRKKAEIQAGILQQTIKEKEEEIIKMKEEIQANKFAQQALQQKVREQTNRRTQEQRHRQLLQKQKKEQEEYQKIRQSLSVQPAPVIQSPKKLLVLVEESIQTEQIQAELQRNVNETLLEKQINIDSNKKIGLSYGGEALWSPRSPSLAANSNKTVSYLSQLNIQIKQNIEDYDYFWELSQIYKQQHTSARVAKQLSYAQFVAKATQRATTIIQNYIDQNKPIASLKIDRHIFQIEIVCQKGKIIKTQQGCNRLIYNNQNHQRLKRSFKIYNLLNDVIFATLKKKPNYPLRVPFCCLVQYKGYTALAKISPAKQFSSTNTALLKSLGNDIPSYNLKITDFEVRGEQLSFATVNIVFKATKEDQVSLIRGKSYDFLEVNRRNKISIQTKKLFQEVDEIQNNSDRIMIAETLAFCRQLKKVMKNTTPFNNPHEQLSFVEQLLTNSKKFVEENCANECSASGITLYYIQKILGIKVKSKWGDTNLNYTAFPVTRQFSLGCLDAFLFANKFQRFCTQRKFELAQQALRFSKELEQDYNLILIKEIQLLIYQQNYSQALEKMQSAFQLLHTNDPKRLKLLQAKAQCYEAIGESQQVLSCYRQLLEQTEYMYANKAKLVEIYFLIAGTLARQRHNKQLVEVYRFILKQFPAYRNKVIIQFCETLLSQQADPHIILDFIQQETSQQTQKYSLEIQMLLGDLYYRCRNVPKAFICFQQAFEMVESSNTTQLTNLFLKLMECSTTQAQKKNIHRQLLSKFLHNNLSKDQIEIINNKVGELIFLNLPPHDKQSFILPLQQVQISKEAHSMHVREALNNQKIIEWNTIEECVTSVCNRTGSIHQLSRYVRLDKLYETCIAMNFSQNL